MSVAALTIAISSFGQCVLSAKDSALLAKIEIENTAGDVIEWVREDVWSGSMDSTIGQLYIDNLELMIRNVRKLREDE